MTETSDRYRKLAAAFTDKVATVPADAWDNASPCEGWTTIDVVDHVVGSGGMFFKFVEQPPPAVPPVADDPMTAWTAARDAMQAALDDPAIAQIEFDGMMGRQTFESAVDRFICADLVIHNWDLSRAAGLDDRLDGAEVERLMSEMGSMGDVLRSSGAFGPEIDPPAGADEQTKLLCFLGRQV